MVDALQDRASSDLAGCLAYRWLVDGERSDCEWTFAELDRRARRIASFLLEKKLTGHRILLVYSPGPEFLEAFWGCLYAGASSEL
jgi:acyl-CoA synthetase (AMP-forming)/AMP-acid ligase II